MLLSCVVYGHLVTDESGYEIRLVACSECVWSGIELVNCSLLQLPHVWLTWFEVLYLRIQKTPNQILPFIVAKEWGGCALLGSRLLFFLYLQPSWKHYINAVSFFKCASMSVFFRNNVGLVGMTQTLYMSEIWSPLNLNHTWRVSVGHVNLVWHMH